VWGTGVTGRGDGLAVEVASRRRAALADAGDLALLGQSVTATITANPAAPTAPRPTKNGATQARARPAPAGGSPTDQASGGRSIGIAGGGIAEASRAEGIQGAGAGAVAMAVACGIAAAVPAAVAATAAAQAACCASASVAGGGAGSAGGGTTINVAFNAPRSANC